MDGTAHMGVTAPYCLGDALQPMLPSGQPGAGEQAAGQAGRQGHPAAVGTGAMGATGTQSGLQRLPTAELLRQMGFDGCAPLASLAPERSAELLDSANGDLSEFFDGAFLTDSQALHQGSGQAWV